MVYFQAKGGVMDEDFEENLMKAAVPDAAGSTPPPTPPAPTPIRPVSYGVLGKSNCIFCRRTRDKVLVALALVVVGLYGWELLETARENDWFS
jgi:hypothetical protein